VPTPSGVSALEERLGHRFADAALVEQALTHASYTNEHPDARDHAVLALLGDAALALVVAERLVTEHPGAPVGVVTPRRAALVSGENLARWASALELGPLLRLGRGEEQTGGRERASILATALEAVMGALYLEAGLPPVRRVVAFLAA
jgi:ribonuclease III